MNIGIDNIVLKDRLSIISRYVLVLTKRAEQNGGDWMKTRIAVVLLVVLLLPGTILAMDRNRKIEPVTDAHAVMTHSLYNQTLNMSPAERKLVYVSYVSGFVDAMQLNSMNNQAASKFLEDCKDLTLGDLIDMMISFKDTNPRWQDVNPAVALTVVVPRLKNGLSPFSDQE